MLVLSMDCLNWSVLERLKTHRDKNELPQIMDIDSYWIPCCV